MKVKLILFLNVILILTGCVAVTDSRSELVSENKEGQNVIQLNDVADIDDETAISDNKSQMITLIDSSGETISERILPPEGYERIEEDESTFGSYLRAMQLKPDGAEVLIFDGRVKGNQDIHAAVLDIDVGDRDLQQCADATMRLWAEYLRSIEQEKDIHFEFTNGFQVDYSKWMEGYRINVDGNNVSWVKNREFSNSDETFKSYMQIIFAYAGTLSLTNELQSVPVEEMRIGDVFVQGGSPGHAVIVVDMAINSKTGERLFLLAQSYMPAQDIHVLINPDNEGISPWYVLDDRVHIDTPEWRFTKSDLRRYE